MLEVKIKAAGRRYMAPKELRRALGAERAREKLANAIEALVTQLDLIDGDPDLEADDSEDSFQLSHDAIAIARNHPPCDPEQDSGSWSEWHTRGRHKDCLGNLSSDGHPLHEDDEDDDNDSCLAGEDNAALFSRGHQMGFAGDRAASDPDSEPSGDEQDTGGGEDEHKSSAHPLDPEDCDRALSRGFWGSGCDSRPSVFDRQLELNDN